MEIRVGVLGQVVKHVLDTFTNEKTEVVGVWMTEEEGVEEKHEEREVKKVADAAQTEFRLWIDEKYYVDELVSINPVPNPKTYPKRSRDVPLSKPSELPDIYTSYRKRVEPLRDAPRRTLPAPDKLPPLPPIIPPQLQPFAIPQDLEGLIAALHKPVSPALGLAKPPSMPPKAASAHPFTGGETPGHDRIKHLVTSGSMTSYKDTVRLFIP